MSAEKPNIPKKSASLNRALLSNQHQRTRRDHANETAEDYVEAIADLEAERGVCRLTDLAKHFCVSHVTVSKIIARLEREGLVETVPYAPMKLTATGLKLAQQSRERHRVVVEFLIALGVSNQTAEIDAEGIEHHVSKETLGQMKKFTHQRESERHAT
jgi:DtxR family manganese transport transcriptional regulator